MITNSTAVALANLDSLDRLEHGELPPPDPPRPDDTATRARLLLDTIPGLTTADKLKPSETKK